MIKDYEFKNNCDLKTLIESYGLEYPKRRDMSLKIGPDGVIYILVHTATNERGYITLSLIVLDVDWDEEKITGSGCYPLGRYPADYYLAQPLEDKILLLSVRSRSNEDNASILDLEGKAERSFCLGDGIQDIYVRSDNTIVTSYFDEGVFSDGRIGSNGVNVWNDKGGLLFHASHNIDDCYAVNIDEHDNIWYDYYMDFKLVCLNEKGETEYEPGVRGPHFFILTEDGQSVIFDSGYYKQGCYERFSLHGKTKENDIVTPIFEGRAISVIANSSYSSKALFLDDQGRLFVKRFIS